eukprot:1105923-Pyramimonas_sp.AAC.1
MASNCLNLTVRNRISSSELTKVFFDFLHAFQDGEYALSRHMNNKVTVLYPTHANNICLLATTCYMTIAKELHVVLQHDPNWMSRRLL